MKILLVDDSTASRKVLANALKDQTTLEILEAFDGRDAIIKVVRENFDIDLILLDWVMPEIDGLEAFTIIKKLYPPAKELVAIMITSKSKKEDILKALQSGVSDYIIKPFNTEILVEKLARMLQKHNKINDQQLKILFPKRKVSTFDSTLTPGAEPLAAPAAQASVAKPFANSAGIPKVLPSVSPTGAVPRPLPHGNTAPAVENELGIDFDREFGDWDTFEEDGKS